MSVTLATLLVTVLASYLAIVHATSFSSSLDSARSASKLAILMMDVLLVAQALAGRRGLFATRPGNTPRTARLWDGLCVLAALAVIGLHIDYLSASVGQASRGVAGSLATIKQWLVVSQVALVVMLAARRRAGSGDAGQPVTRLGRHEVALLVLPAVPLANYFLRNRAEFSRVDAIEYFALLLLLPALLLAGAYALQRLLGAPAVAAPLVAGLAFVHYSMPMVTAWLHRPIEAAFAVQLSLAIGIPAVLSVFYRRSPAAVAMTVVLYGVASITAAALDGPVPEARVTAANGETTYLTDDTLTESLAAPAVRRPDVYLLTYDSYAPASMLRHYGIDNTRTDAFLAANGFTSYPHVNSMFLATRGSMGLTLNMGVPGEIWVAGPTYASRFFQAQGYERHLILSAYLLQGVEHVQADSHFPPRSRRNALNTIYRGIAAGEFKWELVLEDSTREQWLAAKRTVLGAREGAPRMVYTHSLQPGHSQNSGACRPDETARYALRLRAANAELRADVDTILATARDAIIIVAGDHGPYLTGDCLYMSDTPADQLTGVHLADRYGVRLDIRWPTPYRPQIDTLQHVLVAAASYMLDKPPLLDERPPAITEGYGGIPDGAVKDGMVMIGVDKGKPLLPVR